MTNDSLEHLSVDIRLKSETAKTIESLDEQVQEQEKVRQNARAIQSVIQRTKVQLIELRPTMNDEAERKRRVSPSSSGQSHVHLTFAVETR